MKISPFVFALATMICWRTAPLFAKAALLRIDPWMGLAMRSFVMTVIILIWVIATGHIHQVLRVEPSTWALICSEGILASFLGHLSYFYAIKYGMILPSDPHRLSISNGRLYGLGFPVLGKDKPGETGRRDDDNRRDHYYSEVIGTFSLWTCKESDRIFLDKHLRVSGKLEKGALSAN